MQTIISEITPQNREKVRVYAKSAALTAEVSPIIHKERGSKDDIGVTLNLDVAGKGNKGFDWQNKITIQLSENELPEFAALLMGYHDQIKLSRPDKGIEIERQDKALFIKASKQGGGMYAMPVPTPYIFRLNVLVLELLKLQNNTDDGNVIIASLRMFAKT